MSIKGGCITGLTKDDWANARHIWTKNAMVPIPEGVETCEEEPQDDDEKLIHQGVVQKMVTMLD